jgi:murein DD-endopeptidase MepM/ murein hydrolase activator NlpD
MIALRLYKTLTRAAFGAGFAFPALALDLALPVDCTLGETCYIQQYFDHDTTTAWGDFTCGTLAYDGHDGTDFAVPTRADMSGGVAVLAAAPGTVAGIRDGVEDFAPKVDGKECGNGVVVDHGGGWQTQYCHMRMGSVRVAVGDAVDTGTPLGLIGQSGMAQFPHMHLAVRKDGVEVDPFAPTATNTCDLASADTARDDLWLPEITYQAGGIIGAGFAIEVPEFEAIKSGLASPAALPPTSPALVLWVYLFGAKAGDAVVFDITGPDGRIMAERVVLEKNQALLFRAVGRKMPGTGWPEGAYAGTARLMRGAEELGSTAVTLSIEP